MANEVTTTCRLDEVYLGSNGIILGTRTEFAHLRLGERVRVTASINIEEGAIRRALKVTSENPAELSRAKKHAPIHHESLVVKRGDDYQLTSFEAVHPLSHEITDAELFWPSESVMRADLDREEDLVYEVDIHIKGGEMDIKDRLRRLTREEKVALSLEVKRRADKTFDRDVERCVFIRPFNVLLREIHHNCDIIQLD